jgi:imidazolonepropionase-like amidohydrolase
MRMSRRAVVATLALSFAACRSAPTPAPVDLAIANVTVVDVAAGRVTPGQVVTIDDGRITAVSGGPAPAAATTVDGEGAFLMPGLWDNHVHFGGGDALAAENQALLPLYLAHGVTAVRDAAGDLSAQVLDWRSRVAAGTLQGPTIFTSGPKLEGYQSIWPGDIEVGTEAEVRAALDGLQARRVDFVKITDNTLPPDLYLFALAETTRRGLITSAHVPGALTLDQVSEAGLDSIEHMSYLLRAGAPREAALAAAVKAGTMTPAAAVEETMATFDAAVALATYKRLAARGTHVTPTLNGSRILAYLDRDDHANDAYLQYLGAGLQATYKGRVDRAAADDAVAVERRHARYEKSATLVPLLREAGVRLLAGTDAGFLNSFNYPGIGLHDELAVLVSAGLTPREALAASVLNGPAFLRQEGYGAVVPGAVADLVLLRRNPLEDISATRGIAGVVARGAWLDRTALDGLLDAARTQAATTRSR